MCVKLAILIVCFFFFFFYHSLILSIYPVVREEINNLQTNVEFLSNRIDSASTIIASNNVNNEAFNTSSNDFREPVITSSLNHTTPKNYDINSISTASIQPDTSLYTALDDNNAISNNYAISNDNSYEPTSLTHIESPIVTQTSLTNNNNIIVNNNMVDDVAPIYSSSYINEPLPQTTSYVESQSQPGKTNILNRRSMFSSYIKFIVQS